MRRNITAITREYREMVDTAHAMGIKVLQGQVANHSGADHPWVAHLPDLNQANPRASEYLIQNALWWIGMTGVDGIRHDTYPYAGRSFWEAWQS